MTRRRTCWLPGCAALVLLAGCGTRTVTVPVLPAGLNQSPTAVGTAYCVNTYGSSEDQQSCLAGFSGGDKSSEPKAQAVDAVCANAASQLACEAGYSEGQGFAAGTASVGEEPVAAASATATASTTTSTPTTTTTTTSSAPRRPIVPFGVPVRGGTWHFTAQLDWIGTNVNGYYPGESSLLEPDQTFLLVQVTITDLIPGRDPPVVPYVNVACYAPGSGNHGVLNADNAVDDELGWDQGADNAPDNLQDAANFGSGEPQLWDEEWPVLETTDISLVRCFIRTEPYLDGGNVIVRGAGELL